MMMTTTKAMLTRALTAAPAGDRAFFVELLRKYISNNYWDAPRTALFAASGALKLGLPVDDIRYYKTDFQGLSLIAIEGGWLYGFLHTVLSWRANGQSIEPEELMALLAHELVALDRPETELLKTPAEGRLQ